MKQQGYWSKFGKLENNLRESAKLHAVTRSIPNYAEFLEISANFVRDNPKFYIPLPETEFLSSVNSADYFPFNFPFDNFVLLTETKLYDRFGDQTKLMDGWSAVLVKHDADNNRTEFNSFTHDPIKDKWLSATFQGCLADNEILYDMTSINLGVTKVIRDATPNAPSSELEAHIQTYMNNSVAAIRKFGILLSLHGTEKITVVPPVKLAKRRNKQGKPPLYEYHVLKISGEVWDNPHTSESTSGGGVRSHLRRGHIRRLENKNVWVRHTLVHGSREGFVKKDYEFANIPRRVN